MDLLSGSLAQLRRFSAASHQGVDDLTCTGPSVTARSWKALYSSWVCCESSRECCDKLTRCCAHPRTPMRAHWTLGNEQCRAMWKGALPWEASLASALGMQDALPYTFPIFCCTLLSVLFHSWCRPHWCTDVNSVLKCRFNKKRRFSLDPRVLATSVVLENLQIFFFVALPLCPHHHLAFSCACVQVLKVNGYTYLCVYKTNLYKCHFFGDTSTKKEEGFSFLFISVWICCI